jgi:hypothetical protein
MKVIANRRLIYGGALYSPGAEFEHATGRALNDRIASGTVSEATAPATQEAEANALLDEEETEGGKRPTSKSRRYNRRDQTADE